MTFLEKLDLMMAASSINKHKLSIMSGVPYTTIDAFYKKGYENAKISTIRKIAKALGCSLDYLIEEDSIAETKNSPSAAEAAPGEANLVKLYRELNNDGQEKLVDYADDLVSSGKYIKSYPPGLGQKQA